MKILVTGRDGQLARSLAEVGDKAGSGHELIFAGRPDFDLLDPAGMQRVIDAIHPDVIVNAAAYTAVDAAEDDPDTTMAANGVAPGIIARAAARAGAWMIQLSTDYVFDGTLDRPYREDDPVAPLGVYGRSKLAGEQAVREAGVDGAILRTSWVYSPFGSNFVKTMLRLADNRDEVGVVADQTGCPTSALDLAEAILRLLCNWEQAPPAALQTYHATGTGTTNWADLARAVFAERARLIGRETAVRDLATEDYPVKAPRPHNSVLDGGRLGAALGWRLPDWRASVAATTVRLLDQMTGG